MSSTTCNTGGGRRDVIDYEQLKKNFLKLAENKLSNHKKLKFVYQLHTKRRIEQIIAQKLEHPPLHARYEVIKKDGKNILVMKGKSWNSHIQILSWEDMFDIFMPLHVQSGHRGKDILHKEILEYSKKHNVEYRFPTFCLYYFRRLCALCVQNNGKLSVLQESRIGVVHVIPMVATRAGEKFRYLLIYVDKVF